MENSCGKRRGCEINTALPNDGRAIVIYYQVYGYRDDIQEVLFVPYVFLDKVAQEEEALEETYT